MNLMPSLPCPATIPPASPCRLPFCKHAPYHPTPVGQTPSPSAPDPSPTPSYYCPLKTNYPPTHTVALCSVLPHYTCHSYSSLCLLLPTCSSASPPSSSILHACHYIRWVRRPVWLVNPAPTTPYRYTLFTLWFLPSQAFFGFFIALGLLLISFSYYLYCWTFLPTDIFAFYYLQLGLYMGDWFYYLPQFMVEQLPLPTFCTPLFVHTYLPTPSPSFLFLSFCYMCHYSTQVQPPFFYAFILPWEFFYHHLPFSMCHGAPMPSLPPFFFLGSIPV